MRAAELKSWMDQQAISEKVTKKKKSLKRPASAAALKK